MANNSSSNVTGVWNSPPSSTTTVGGASTTTVTHTHNMNNTPYIPKGIGSWPSVTLPTVDESAGISFVKDGVEVYRFSSDVEAVEAIVHWIFENTTGRFYSLGTSRWYFELLEDAVAFELVFKGHKLVDNSKVE